MGRILIIDDDGSVVTDLLMPEKDGIEAVLELRAEFPDVDIFAVAGGDTGSTGGLLEAQAMSADTALLR